MIADQSIRTAVLMAELGMSFSQNHVEIVDFERGGFGYVHHSRMPIAVAGFAVSTPDLARERFPKFSFVDMIQMRSRMDEDEVCALAEICGIDVAPPFWGNPGPFGEQVWSVIERYELDPFFQRVEQSWGEGGDQYLMRPRGFDWSDPDRPEIPGALRQWRNEYKRLPVVRQLMVTTLLQLYLQGNDKYWMVRVPKNWNAAEGIALIRAGGALRDWARLYALYPGW